MNKIKIHTTISPEARRYIQRVQDLGDGQMNTAIESIIAANKVADMRVKSHVLDMVIDEVLNRYMIERGKSRSSPSDGGE